MGKKIRVNVSYMNNNDYELSTRLIMLDLDKQAEEDIKNNRGFRVTYSQGTKKNLLSPDSIYSTRFGETNYSENPYVSRYKCDCGHMKGSKYEGTTCPKCKTLVKFIDDDYGYFGYLIMDNYEIIHPIIFKQLQAFIGADELNKILEYNMEKDTDGNIIREQQQSKSQNHKYYGIGLIEFRKRFHEIMDFYLTKKKDKVHYYESIMGQGEDIIFTHTIPVFTIHLRPLKLTNAVLDYDDINDYYAILSKLVNHVNKKNHDRNTKRVNQLLYNIQSNYNLLTDSIISVLNGKKGEVRRVFGGRYSFSARGVISPKPGVIDEIQLPYVILAELLKQSIINVLVKSNSITPNAANNIWSVASRSKKSKERTIVKNIINNIIKNTEGGKGIPVLLNRNPTIEFGSIQQMYVTSMNDNYTIGIPMQVLGFFAADFDGDQLNIMHITNKRFKEATKIFNPKNLYISHNDGLINKSILHNKDLLININSLRLMTEYTPEQLKAIENCIRS